MKEKSLKEKHGEFIIKERLKEYLKKRGWKVIEKERKLPPPKGSKKSCKPDIIAYLRRGDKLIIIEVKRSTSHREIGKAFGQLHVDEAIIKRIRKRDWEKFLKKKIKARKISNIIFGIAFDERVWKDQFSKKIIRSFMNKFGYRVYLVGKNKIRVYRPII